MPVILAAVGASRHCRFDDSNLASDAIGIPIAIIDDDPQNSRLRAAR